MISPIVVLAPHEEVAKALPVVRLVTHKVFVSVDVVVGLELLATTLADKKNMATVLQNFVLVRNWKRLESLAKDITVCEPSLFILLCPPTVIQSRNKINSLTNPSLTHAACTAGPDASSFRLILALKVM